MRTIYMRALTDGLDEQAAPGTPIRFVASTEGVKRDGQELRVADWRVDNYRKNPVFLWAHDYMGQHLPIGRAEVGFEGRHLVAEGYFDQDDEFARQVERKYRNKFLHSVSVGWGESEDGGNELLDISAVPVPGDPDALMERQMRAWRAFLADASVTQTGSEGARVGAVLNTRNHDALEQARDLIQSVLDSAQKESKAKDEEPAEDKDADRERALLDEILIRLNTIK